MSANPTDWRAEAQANIDRGDIPVITRRRGEGVIDPRDQFARAPEFPTEASALLPKLFTDFVQDRIAIYGGDPGAYAINFMSMHCAVLHASVKMQNNPLDPDNLRNPNEFALTVGKSGANKSGMFKDLTRCQMNWQKAVGRATASVSSARKQQPPMWYLQNASVEGVMKQIADNKGERLLLAFDEAMGFYDGSGLHHKENSVRAMSDVVTAIYDGGMYSKRLVNSSYSIPEALATLIMTTTLDKLVKWKSFGEMVSSGLMGRHTVAMLANVHPSNEANALPGAEKALHDFLLTMRGMRDFRFILADDAQRPWLDFKRGKEAANEALLSQGATEGLVYWARKYDMRIMTMATILQCYDAIQGGIIKADPVAMPDEVKSHKVAEARVISTIRISKDNLTKAVDFVEGYLMDSQEFFYKRATGITEFSDELMNFIAYRVTSDEPDNPDCRIIARETLTHKGPAKLRGAATDERKQEWNRWIETLLFNGYIEVYEKPGQRPMKRARADCEMPHYKMTDAFYEAFGDREFWRGIYEESRLIGGMRTRLKL